MLEAAVSKTTASVVLFVIEETVALVVVVDGDHKYVAFVDTTFALSVGEVVVPVSLANAVLVFAGRVAVAVIFGVLLVAWLIVVPTV